MLRRWRLHSQALLEALVFDPTGLHSTGPAPGVRLSGHAPSAPAPRSLPSFLSAAPPRSEGEALLRRIFAPSAQV